MNGRSDRIGSRIRFSESKSSLESINDPADENIHLLYCCCYIYPKYRLHTRLVIASFSDYSLEKSIFALKYYSLSLVASSIKIYSLSLDILSNSVFASRYYSLLHFSLKWSNHSFISLFKLEKD